MINFRALLRKRSVFAFIFCLFSLAAFSQESLKSLERKLSNAKTPASKAKILNQLSSQAITENNFNKSLDYATKALSISKAQNLKRSEADALINLLSYYKLKREFPKALDYGIQAQKVIRLIGDDIRLYNSFLEVSFLYQDWDIDQKAIENLEKAYAIAEKLRDDEKKINVANLLGLEYLKLNQTDKTLNYYNQIKDYYKKTNNQSGYISTIKRIADLFLKKRDYEKALVYNQEILTSKRAEGDSLGIAKFLNDIGYIYMKLNRGDNALDYFQEAIAVNEAIGRDENDNSTLLINIGVILQGLGKLDEALKKFLEVRDIKKRKGDAREIALINTYIATIYLGRRDYNDARAYTEDAIIKAREAGDVNLLEKAYTRLADIYKLSGNNKKALAVYEDYVAIKDSLYKAEKKEREALIQKLFSAEKKEKEISMLLQEQEMKDVQLEKLALEGQRKEQELKLLEQEKTLLARKQALQKADLQQEELKRKQVAQQLQLTQQKLNAEKRQQEYAALENEKKLRDLELKQKELEEKERLDQVERLKSLNELQDLEIKSKQEREFLVAGILIFFVLALIVTLIAVFKNRRKNKRLAEQNVAILEQKQEIEEQNEQISLQKAEVEQAYNNIQSLSEFGQKITSSLDFDAINWTVYSFIKSLCDATHFGIGLYKKDLRVIEFINFLERGVSVPNFLLSLKAEDSLAVTSFKNQKEIFMNNVEGEYQNYLSTEPTFKTKNPAKSVIYIPLMTDKPLGVFTVQSDKLDAYTEKHLSILRTLASYISIALENANAYDEINAKNQHITDSIRYARTIQKAILPSQKQLRQTFDDQFVIFKPKDIVSGDYYWYTHINAGDNHQKLKSLGLSSLSFIAAVDCTGHGVPGAFMSMIGNTLLNEIVNVKSIYEPKMILEYLNEGIVKALKQEDQANDDGMDICLCAISKNGFAGAKVSFTGAKRPLYYLPANSGHLMEIKGDNRSIGGMIGKKSEREFSNNEFYLDKGSTIYLCTDGISDQNNQERRKFGTKKLKQVLQANVHKPLKDQKVAIESALKSHQGNSEQRDDITMIAVKI